MGPLPARRPVVCWPWPVTVSLCPCRQRYVLPPSSCPDSARPAYSSLRPCSVDLAAGNVFFLAAMRPRPHVINDARISALTLALRPRRDDQFGSRTVH